MSYTPGVQSSHIQQLIGLLQCTDMFVRSRNVILYWLPLCR